MTTALQHGVWLSDTAPHDVVLEQGVAPRRMLLIHNPTAGLFRRRLRKALAILAGCDAVVDVRQTRCSGDAWRMARDAPADLSAILVAGGDGTINEVVNGLMERPPPRPPLGLLPSGTANVLARELGLPLRPDRAAEALADAEPRTIHLGRVNGRYFTAMAGVGLDARIVAGLSPVLKRYLGRAGYTIETLHQMLFHPPPRMTVVADGTEFHAHSIIAANARYYGGGIKVAPQARATRGGLDLCVFEGQGPWTTFRQTASAILGRHLRRADVKLVPAQTIRIDGPDGAPIQADGELIGRLPAIIESAGAGIEILVPPDLAAPTRAGAVVQVRASHRPPAGHGR